MDLQCILCIANSSYVVKTPKDEVTCNTYWNFYKDLKIWTCFPQNGRFQNQTGGQETTSQNGRVGTYGFMLRKENLHFFSWIGKNWEVQPEQHSKLQNLLVNWEKLVSTCSLRITLKNPNLRMNWERLGPKFTVENKWVIKAAPISNTVNEVFHYLKF